jgi:hypothetical protein
MLNEPAQHIKQQGWIEGGGREGDSLDSLAVREGELVEVIHFLFGARSLPCLTEILWEKGLVPPLHAGHHTVVRRGSHLKEGYQGGKGKEEKSSYVDFKRIVCDEFSSFLRLMLPIFIHSGLRLSSLRVLPGDLRSSSPGGVSRDNFSLLLQSLLVSVLHEGS